jgi:hypothetical protein
MPECLERTCPAYGSKIGGACFVSAPQSFLGAKEMLAMPRRQGVPFAFTARDVCQSAKGFVFNQHWDRRGT